MLWIEVNVPQSKAPLNFLLDTGAGVSVINLSTAKRIGLRLGRKVMVHGVGTMLNGFWTERMSAKVGDVQLPREYLSVDLEKLSSSCERPVDGLVGADFFRDRVVQIDFDSQKIRLLKPEKQINSDEALPLQLRPCGMRMPISVNGHKHQWVRLDTGCATALQWVTSDVRPEQCARRMAIGLVEISIPQTETTVGLGKHEFEKVPTGLHDEAIFPGEAGLLGNGLLSRFSTVTIDAKAGRLMLGKRRVVD
jgi:Aspartyl protease